MKLSEILKEPNAEKEPEEISVLLSAEVLNHCGLDIVLESVWVNSGYKDWMYRVDPKDPRIPQQRHIHIAKKKHTSAKNMQASWNEDGTRHDKKSFNAAVGDVNRVREIATNVLKIAPDIALESMETVPACRVLKEDISNSFGGKIAYITFNMA